MSDAADYAIGVDAGATNVKLVAVSSDGKELDQRRFATQDDQTSSKWADRIRDEIALIEKSRGKADAIGVAAPGLAAADGRSIWWMHGRMSGLMNLDWTRHLGRERTVPVLNDAHAALLGEMWLGAAKGAKNVAMLTLGTGVGGAVACDGKLLRGNIGRAGHLGHVTVDASGPRDFVNTPGSLEDAIGEYNLRQRSGGKFETTRQMLDAARRGDSDAERIWLSSVRALAAAIAGIINVIDPQIVILGGGIAQAGDELMRPLEKMMDEFEWRPHGHRVKMVTAALGDRAGALGAAWFALNGESK